MGADETKTEKRVPLIFKFLANFYHLMALLLWAAAVLAFLSEQPQLGYAIIGVIIINALFSFGQEFKAEKAVEALKKLVPLMAKVIRDGRKFLISYSRAPTSPSAPAAASFTRPV